MTFFRKRVYDKRFLIHWCIQYATCGDSGDYDIVDITFILYTRNLYKNASTNDCVACFPSLLQIVII